MRQISTMLVRALVFSTIALLSGAPGSAVQVERILTGLEEPVWLAAPEGDDRLFILERPGRILVYENGALLPDAFLDLTSVVDTGGVGAGNEGGLLGLAFDPDFATNRAFYVYYTIDGTGGDALTSRISRFLVDPTDPDAALPGSEKILLTVGQPSANHNGGTILFGHDDMLYWGLGDGGGQNDPDETGQDPDVLLGKMLRLDVSFSDPQDDYAIPGDNPFVGPDGIRDEIWALGLRNPYRFSFDRLTGDLYIGDVGQNRIEEVDVQAASSPGGENYGWDVMEGTECFAGGQNGSEPPCFDPSFTDPVFEYLHDDPPGTACGSAGSITGGVVYRGTDGGLFGQYLFADFNCSGIWSFEWDGGAGIVGGSLVDRTVEFTPDESSIVSPVAFGEDGQGEVYIADLRFGGTTGEVFRLVPEPGQGLLVLVGGAVLALCGRGRSRR
jgi:glucose/arabinose dehydrogenase